MSRPLAFHITGDSGHCTRTTRYYTLPLHTIVLPSRYYASALSTTVPSILPLDNKLAYTSLYSLSPSVILPQSH